MGALGPLEAAGAGQAQREIVTGCILLLLAEEPSHGYALHERVHDLMPLWEVAPSTVYRELRGMEAQGLVLSVWEPSQTQTRVARRIYELTPAGRSALDDWAGGVESLLQLLESCITQHSALPPPERRRRQRPA